MTFNFFLGGNRSYSFEGVISEVRVWNTARTQTEIQDNMNTVLTGTETGLVAYYKFDEGTGTTLTDYAGTNDGTIYGASWVGNYAPQGNRISPQLDLSTIDVVDSSTISWSFIFRYTSRLSSSSANYPSSNDATGYNNTSGESEPCSGLLTFEQALQHAYDNGGRLPTKDEVINGAVQVTGCGYDQELIWTCDKGSNSNEHWVTGGDHVDGDYAGVSEIRQNTDTAYVRFVADDDLNRADAIDKSNDQAILDFFGVDLIVETSVDNQSTWQTATNGGSIANIQGADILYVRQTLSTTDTIVTPVLDSLNIIIEEGYYITGTVEEDGVFVERTVRLYKRSTGELVDEGISDSVDGGFSLITPDQTEHYVVALDDISDATDYNALIYDRVIPVAG